VPKGILVVQSRPSDPSRDDEFNEWYADTHIPEVCAIPGIVSARRYKVHDAGFVRADPSAPRYLAIYEIDTDDLADPLEELVTRAGDGRIAMSDVLQLDPPPGLTLYELLD
jgi:hypothetical protein